MPGEAGTREAGAVSQNALRDSGIYQIRNTVTGRYYIGCSGLVLYRWIKHRELLRAGKHRNKRLQREWTEHGEDAFECRIIEYVGSGHYDYDALYAAERRHLIRSHTETPGLLYNEQMPRGYTTRAELQRYLDNRPAWAKAKP